MYGIDVALLRNEWQNNSKDTLQAKPPDVGLDEIEVLLSVVMLLL